MNQTFVQLFQVAVVASIGGMLVYLASVFSSGADEAPRTPKAVRPPKQA